MSEKINQGDTVETIDHRRKEPRKDIRRVVGFIKGPAGGIHRVLFTINDQLPAQSATPTVWLRWKAEERARNGAQAKPKPLPGYLRQAVVKPIADDAPPSSTETRDVLTKPVQRRCRICPVVFLTRVVTVHDCPGCVARQKAAAEAAAAKKARGAE